MTYNEFRRFGYVSKLSEALVCKGASGNINTANSIAGSQLGVASEAGQRSAADYAQFKSLMNPLIQRDQALASGNREEALSAAMPMISKLSSGWNGAKQSILNSMPPGAARDRALADLTTQMYSSIGGAQAGLVQEAPKNLASTGGSLANISLQELGAMLSGYQGGSQTNEGAGKMAAAQQKALLDFFGGLAGSAAGMISPIKVCWIAEAIYGPTDYRTLTIRAWLTGRYSRTAVGACVVRVYRTIGRQVGWAARRSPILRRALKPLFDKALSRAVALS